MSTGANKEIARQFVEEVWGQGNIALADMLMAQSCIDHNPAVGLTPDRAGHHQLLMQVRSAFPNAHFTLDDVIAEGDRVVDRWTMEATHTGALGPMPPTGKQIRMTGMDILRISNGQIVEIWHIEDTLGLMQQLGAIPGPNAG